MSASEERSDNWYARYPMLRLAFTVPITELFRDPEKPSQISIASIAEIHDRLPTKRLLCLIKEPASFIHRVWKRIASPRQIDAVYPKFLLLYKRRRCNL